MGTNQDYGPLSLNLGDDSEGTTIHVFQFENTAAGKVTLLIPGANGEADMIVTVDDHINPPVQRPYHMIERSEVYNHDWDVGPGCTITFEIVTKNELVLNFGAFDQATEKIDPRMLLDMREAFSYMVGEYTWDEEYNGTWHGFFEKRWAFNRPVPFGQLCVNVSTYYYSDYYTPPRLYLANDLMVYGANDLDFCFINFNPEEDEFDISYRDSNGDEGSTFSPSSSDLIYGIGVRRYSMES